MKNSYLIILCIFFFASISSAQDNKKDITATRITVPPDIDGILSEEIWENLPVLADFVKYFPYNGSPCSQRTEAKVCYDDQAIYIGASKCGINLL